MKHDNYLKLLFLYFSIKFRQLKFNIVVIVMIGKRECEMKKRVLSSFIFLLVSVSFSFDVSGQVYEKIYAESGVDVQNKLNQNKLEGIDILSGIIANHVIGITGIGFSQKTALESLLENDERIISFVLNSDMSSLTLVSKGSLTEEEFTALIQKINGVVTGFTSVYSVSN